jgi:hypothetical protein
MASFATTVSAHAIAYLARMKYSSGSSNRILLAPDIAQQQQQQEQQQMQMHTVK